MSGYTEGERRARSIRAFKHGHAVTSTGRPTSEYRSWQGMKSRCSNPKANEYHRYGGRGITVCDRWTSPEGFKNFLSDMGPKPAFDYSINRINNDGNYEPSNCCWATRAEQELSRHPYRRDKLSLRWQRRHWWDWEIYLGEQVG